ncbi:tRNA(Ile)-lysidine synthetase [Microbacterium esteraromaticum]|uniref:tRNA(Ile)-lysidine synthase n=1 Tax=Microbacterium esteraromaticum TaxID=57043 RepID=A0A1R4KPX2_9MICO|nr:tRNA lysidine(34) synthetase TilS [Microbacterium esteraromaticum]SJN46054.1 tRNA(Ile)-lysidine synthetase [Microbacterium esteraromaticum]
MPSLDPAIAEVRLAVRNALVAVPETRVIVGLSGGADSLALTAAVAFEATKLGMSVVAAVVDHGLQSGSDAVAQRAATQARELDVEAMVLAIEVDDQHPDGPEAAARAARYAALARFAAAENATAVLLGHTLDDQAETVLLGLARGSGAASLQGMAPSRQDGDGMLWLRPLLTVRRATTVAFCAASALPFWNDPHNLDTRYARVRVRTQALPVLEAEIGPGIAEALARTAEQLREDAEAFDEMIHETIEDIVEHAEAGISVSVAALAANPAALRNRILRFVVDSEFGVSLSRSQTVEVARLVTDWSGQGPIDLPACSARRAGGRIVFTAR